MCRFVVWTVGLLTALALVGSAAGDSSLSVGQTPAPNTGLNHDLLILQTGVSTGTSYTVPSGTWHMTSWNVNVGADLAGLGPMAAVLATPAGDGSYTIDAVTPAETPSPGMLNSFPVSLTVHGGDVLGVWNGTGFFENALNTGAELDTVAFASSPGSPPAAGATFSTTPDSMILLPVSVTLESASPTPPPDPAQLIDGLQTTVSGMGLPTGTATALNSSLQNALDALATNNTKAACNMLQAFLNKVRAQAGKKLTPDQADQLASEANEIRAQLGC